MPWIRFNPLEESVIDAYLETPGGEPFSLSSLRGRSGAVVLFTHGAGCQACEIALQEFTQKQTAFRDHEAGLFLVVPGAARLPQDRHPAMLVDATGVGRDSLASLLEFDTQAKVLLFILDRYGTPYAAWVGDDPPPEGLADEALNWLEFIAIQCPE